MSKNQLENCVSAFVSKNKGHCLLFNYNEEEKEVEIVGDDVWVNALKSNMCLMNEIRKTLLDTATKRNESSTPPTSTFARATSLPLLFAKPFSKAWKGVKIRSQLSQYLECFGFGHNKPKKFGVDSPPQGWPLLIDWSKFKGPSKGCSLPLCSEIIFSLLEAQGIDPMMHYPATLEIETEREETESGIDEQEKREVPPQKKRVRGQKAAGISLNVIEAIAETQKKQDETEPALKRRKQNIEELRCIREAILEDGEILD